MANKMIMTITISYEAKTRLEYLAKSAKKSMSKLIEDLIMAGDSLSHPQSTTPDQVTHIRPEPGENGLQAA